MSFAKVICENYLPARYTDPASSLKDHIDIWLARVSFFLPFLEEIKTHLPDEEISKSKKYHHLEDSQAFLIRHALRRLILAKYLAIRPKEIQFSTGENKKPVISGSDAGIHFNTSHSYDLMLFTFSNTESGADVEHVRDDFEYDEVLEYSFSKQEIFLIRNSPDPRSVFFKLWTRKEALLKATAKGIGDDLASIPSTDGTHEIASDLLGSTFSWQVRSFTAEGLYEASIAHHAGLEPRLIECDQEILFNTNE